MPLLTIVIVGDRNVGKTSFMKRHLFGSCEGHSTVASASIRDDLTLDDNAHVMSIRTTIGMVTVLLHEVAKECDLVKRSSIGHVDAAIVMYDTTRRETYASVFKWISFLTTTFGRLLPIAVCGNKADERTADDCRFQQQQQQKQKQSQEEHAPSVGGVDRDVFAGSNGNSDGNGPLQSTRHGRDNTMAAAIDTYRCIDKRTAIQHQFVSVVTGANVNRPLLHVIRSCMSEPALTFIRRLAVEQESGHKRPDSFAGGGAQASPDANLAIVRQIKWQGMDCSPLVQHAIAYAFPIMSKHDGSHDWHHVERVVANACEIMDDLKRSSSEHVRKVATFDEEIVIAGCVLHDVADHKYIKDSGVDEDAAVQRCIDFIRERIDADRTECDADHTYPWDLNRLGDIIRWTSFSKSQRAMREGSTKAPCFIELDIVRDADRLDALGAVGITRVAMFGAVRGSIIVSPSELPLKTDPDGHTVRAAAMGSIGDTGTIFGHYYAKLLHLPSSMRTLAAIRMARERAQLMAVYLNGIIDECSLANRYWSPLLTSHATPDVCEKDHVSSHSAMTSPA